MYLRFQWNIFEIPAMVLYKYRWKIKQHNLKAVLTPILARVKNIKCSNRETIAKFFVV